MRLPAYGRPLLKLRRLGRRPSEFVFVTSLWEVAQCLRDALDYYAVVCDPPELGYDFRLLRELDVVIVDFAGELLREQGEAIDAVGPASVRYFTARRWCDLTMGFVEHLRSERSAPCETA